MCFNLQKLPVHELDTLMSCDKNVNVGWWRKENGKKLPSGRSHGCAVCLFLALTNFHGSGAGGIGKVLKKITSEVDMANSIAEQFLVPMCLMFGGILNAEGS